MRVCSGAGCLRVVPEDVRFCDECLADMQKASGVPGDIRDHTTTDRERFAFLYSGRRWQAVRIQVIRACPMCDRCSLHISEIADHIVPAGVAIIQAQLSGLYPLDRWAGFYFRSNLHGLCRECHYLKTNEDKTHTGPWPDVVEREQFMAAKRVWTF